MFVSSFSQSGRSVAPPLKSPEEFIEKYQAPSGGVLAEI